MRLLLGVATAAVLPTLALAQTEQQLKAAAETIAAADIARHVGVIGHDSMQGRDTPSAGLEKTAAYVADQFAKAGLRPAGDSTGWLSHYWMLPHLDFAHSRISFTAGGKTVATDLSRAARLVDGHGPEHSTPAPVVLVAGRVAGNVVEQAKLQDKIVIFVAPKPGPWNADSGQVDPLGQIYGRTAGLVVLSSQDSSNFARTQYRVQQSPGIRPSTQWAASVRPEAVAGLQEMLTANGIDLARLRTDTTPTVRELPSFQVALDLKLDRVAGDSATASNVIGFLDGSDPKLKDQLVVFVAHMDANGPSRRPNDDGDNAAGVASLIALAKAFAQSDVRPARSVVFLATSGGARDFRGSNAFLTPFQIAAAFRAMFGGGNVGGGIQILVGPNNSTPGSASPDSLGHVDLSQFRPVVAVNLDHIAHSVGDSVVIDGVGDAQFASQPGWVASAYPELHLNVVDGPTAGLPTSDQFSFVRRGVPSLYFHSVLDDSLASTAHPSAADLDWTARVARLAFYVGREIANAEHTPAWTREGRRAFLAGAGQ